MRKYRLVAKKGEGTFSEVLKAQNVKDGRYHAIKCMKNRFESIDQVNNLREIQALRRLSPHEHIISLEEVLYDQPTGRLALVFELMDANLYEMIKGRRHYLAPAQIKGYMWQIMKSLDHMHRKGIFHRDIKPENILVDANSDPNRGLKLADFGSCRGIYSKQPYTEYISTRWYRAPECLLTDGYYGPEMDMWGAGCVMFEITSLYPLFPGSNEVDQISRIHKVLGTPAADVLQRFRSKGASHITFDFPPQKGIGIPQLIPHASPDAIDLIVKLIKYDATERISARETMRHPYFREHRELEMRRTQGESTKQASTAGSALPSTTGGDGVVSLASTRTSKQNRSIDAITQSSTASTNNNSSNYSTNGSNSNNNNDFINQPPVLVGSSLNVGKTVPATNDASTKSGGSIMVGLAQKADSNGQGQGQVAIGSKAALPSIVATNNTTSTFDSQLVRQPPQNHALSLTADLQQQMNTSQPKMPPININNTSGNVTNSSMLPPIVSGGGGIQQQQQQQLLLAGGGANGGGQSGRSQKASAASANTTSSSTAAAGAAAAAAKKRKKYRMSGVGGVGNVQQQMNSSEQQQQQQQQQQQSQGLKAFGLSKASIGVTAMGGGAGGDMKGGEYKSSNHYGAQGRQQSLASKKL